MMNFDLKETTRRIIHRLGYDIHKYYPTFKAALKRNNIGLILDVGANEGQAARHIRQDGFAGRIISFEPLSAVRPKLELLAANDSQWMVAPRCAVGSTPGEVEINIAGNSQSSSILTMLDRHVTAVPQAAYIDKERVPVITLDSFLDSRPEFSKVPMALKMDTQGYEAQVLGGLQKWSENVKLIHTEMSLTTLYDGESKFTDLYQMIEGRGYRCIRLEPAWADVNTHEVLQVDAVFERYSG